MTTQSICVRSLAALFAGSMAAPAWAQLAAGDIFWTGANGSFWHVEKNWRVYDPDPKKRPNKIPDGVDVKAFIGSFMDGNALWFPFVHTVQGKQLIAPNIYQNAGGDTTIGHLVFDIDVDKNNKPVNVVVRSHDKTNPVKAAGQTLKFDVSKNNASIVVANNNRGQITSAIELLDSIDITVGTNAELQIRTEDETNLPEIIKGAVGKDLTKKGNGVLFLRTPNSKFDGKVVVEGGTLQVGAPSALGAVGDSTQVQNGGTLSLKRVVGDKEGVAFDYQSKESLALNGNGFDGQGALRSFTGKGTNVFSGDITLETDSRIHVSGGLLLDNTISDGGNGRALDKAGNGDLRLAGTNTYGGNTTISAGRLTVLADRALGTAAGFTVISDNASLAFESDTALTYTLAEQLRLMGGGSIVNVKGDTSFPGALRLGPGPKNQFINVERAKDTLTISGAVSDLVANDPSVGIKKQGPGRARLAGVPLASAAPIDIERGTLAVEHATFDAGADVTILNNAALEGNGDLARRIVAANAGAVLRPLPDPNNPAPLKVDSLWMAPDSFFHEILGGTQAGGDFGQVTVIGGMVSIDKARLALDLTFAPSLGDEFVIVDNQWGSPIDGRFGGVAYGNPNYPDGVKGAMYGGQDYRFAVSYAQNNGRFDIVLTAIPAPGAAAVLVALPVVAGRRRRA